MQEKNTVTMPKANGTEYRISELEPLFTRRFVVLHPEGPGFKIRWN
ncbi:unnamed protein product [Brassica oleracea]